MNEPKPQRQSFSTKPINKPTGTDNITAVKKESCRGEMFFGESIIRRYKAQGLRHKSYR